MGLPDTQADVMLHVMRHVAGRDKQHLIPGNFKSLLKLIHKLAEDSDDKMKESVRDRRCIYGVRVWCV